MATDQSLEDIATQLEAALAAETGTTVAPGTISPVGIFEPSGKRRLSWPEIIKKIQEGIGLAETDILPNIPGGFAAPAFFRAGISSGFLPSGATTFTQAPFTEGFASRMAIAQGLVPQTAAEATTPVTADTTQVQSTATGARKSQIGSGLTTDADEYDLKYGSGAPGPGTIPGKKMSFMEFLATALLPFGGGGVALGRLGKDLGDYMTGKTDLFMDLSTAEPELIQGWYNRGEFGDLNTERGRKQADNVLRLYASGERNITFGGEVADPTTGRTLFDYEGRTDLPSGKILDWTQKDWEEDFAGKRKKGAWDQFLQDIFGDSEGEVDSAPRSFVEGYNEDGTHTNQFGKITAMGGWDQFAELIETDPQLAYKVAQARSRGGIFGIDPILYDRAMTAYAHWKQNKDRDDSSDGGTTTTTERQTYPPDLVTTERQTYPPDLVTTERQTYPPDLVTTERQTYPPDPLASDDRFQDAVSTGRNLGLDIGTGRRADPWATARGPQAVTDVPGTTPEAFPPDYYGGTVDPGSGAIPGVLTSGVGDLSDIEKAQNLRFDAQQRDAYEKSRQPLAIPQPSILQQRIEYDKNMQINRQFTPDYYGGAGRQLSVQEAIERVSPDTNFSTDWDRQVNSLIEGTWSITQGGESALWPSESRPDDITSAPPVKQHAKTGSVIDAARIAKIQPMTYPPASSDPVVAAYDPVTDYGSVGGGGEFGGTPGDTGYEGGFSAWQSGGQVGMQEGGMAPPMPMPPQGGMAPPMQQPQAPAQSVDTDIANLGLVADQGAAQPQNGGEQSVQDDVAMQANEGDYILPYETVLLTGLNQLNRYAREAIQLAIENSISLQGTDLDPTDDVPIKVSNYEYHIPKVLVPFFGGGKKYLDKIRDEGLALRTRLEEEKEPSMQEQQPMPQEQQLAAAAAAPEPQMAQAGPPEPQMPMMQTGGFVPDPNDGQQPTPTTAAILEGDTSQQTTAYNQLKALQHSKKTQQQPPMVDPTGKVIPQGFAAPQGYFDAGPVYAEKAEHEAALREQQKETLKGLKDFQQLAFIGNLESSKREEAIAYMNIVPNRMAHKSFPNKAYDVIFQENAFSPLKHNADPATAKNWERGVSSVNFGDERFADLQRISKDILGKRNSVDPTFGAIYAINQKQYNQYQSKKAANEPGYSAKAIPDHLNNAILRAKKLPEVYKTATIGKTDFYAEKPKKQKVVTQPDDSSQSPPPPDPYSEEQKQEWEQHGYDIHTETRDAGERDWFV